MVGGPALAAVSGAYNARFSFDAFHRLSTINWDSEPAKGLTKRFYDGEDVSFEKRNVNGLPQWLCDVHGQARQSS